MICTRDRVGILMCNLRYYIMVKVYETIVDARLVTSVEVDGKYHTVTFVGGSLSPKWRAAMFVCEDETLQRAIESSTSYGVSYRLKDIKKSESSKDIVLINVEEVTNKQSAIEWMRKNMDKRFALSVDVSILTETAAEGGYVFLNWERDGK